MTETSPADSPAEQIGMTPALCSWTDGGSGEDWTLRVTLPASGIPAEAAPGVEREIFADLNGVTDRRNVPGGIMVRRSATADDVDGTVGTDGTAGPVGADGIGGPDGGEATTYWIELTVPRGYRGALRFLPVPRGLQVADRPTWLDALERGFIPAGGHGLREVMDMRRKQVLEIAAPDARPLIWTGGDEAGPQEPHGAGDAPASEAPSGGDLPSADEHVVTLGSSPRRIWIHRPQRGPASAPVLVVFDGERFVRGGLLTAIDELVSPPSAVIAVDHAPVGESGPDEDAAIGQRADDLVMNPRFCDDVLALVRQAAPDVSARTIVAGASYGGLAAAFFSLRHPEAFRGICLSPSFWESDDQGRRIWDHVPSRTDDGPVGTVGESESYTSEPVGVAAHPTFCVDHGILEKAIADSVAEAIGEFAARGIDILPRPFVGGHEYLWWRELMLVRLAEVLAE